jgi:hypothetical protein
MEDGQSCPSFPSIGFIPHDDGQDRLSSIQTARASTYAIGMVSDSPS